MKNQQTNNEWIEKLIDKIGYLKRYSDTRYFDWEEVKKELRKILSKGTTSVEPVNQESEQSQAEKVVEIKYVIRKCVCKTTLGLSDNYCPNCGAKIKWI